tara:strand:+ start:1240 stop:1437 length:198 start_codon:yes stop_codon:yes gene_type:complete
MLTTETATNTKTETKTESQHQEEATNEENQTADIKNDQGKNLILLSEGGLIQNSFLCDVFGIGIP